LSASDHIAVSHDLNNGDPLCVGRRFLFRTATLHAPRLSSRNTLPATLTSNVGWVMMHGHGTCYFQRSSGNTAANQQAANGAPASRSSIVMVNQSPMRASIEWHLAGIGRIAGAVEGTLSAGGRVLTCGNGGSAAEALHLAEEMIGCFCKKRVPLAAICLASDPAAMTCIANDYGYEELFARQVEGLGRTGDVLVVLSTSGRSPNILRALERARRLGLATIGLLGRPASPAEALCDLALTVNAPTSAQIQEIHLLAIHLILEHLDARF
jgi:D-sedoheptulose 7-phosphate isomerase